MKRTLFNWTLVLLSLCIAPEIFATYYIAGNGTDDPNGKWCNGNNWGFIALDANNSITFEGVAAGHYGFKITDGEWGPEHEFTTYDYENSDDPVYGGHGGDMGFSLSETSDVTITFVNEKVQLHASTSLAYRTDYYYLAGNGSGGNASSWCSGQNWKLEQEGSQLVNNEKTYTSLPAGDYQFKVTHGNSWNPEWNFNSFDAANSSPAYYADGTNICFSLTEPANVTIKLVRDKVQLIVDREFNVTGNGEDKGNGKWCGGNNWWAKDNSTKMDENLSITFRNVPAATGYKFRVKDHADNHAAWNTHNVFGFAECDTEHSYACTGDGSNNICFDLDLPADVTIQLVNNKVVFTTSPIYYITGSMNSWATANTDYRLLPEDGYTKMLSLGIGEHKLRVINGKWPSNGGTVWNYDNFDADASSFGCYVGTINDKNICFYLNEEADVTIHFNPETEKISIRTSAGNFHVSTYSIAGNETLTGFDWDGSETSTEMTDLGNGTYRYIKTDQSLSKGSYEYKVLGNHRWDNGLVYPVGHGNNASISIAEDGVYTLIYTFEPSTKTLNCTAHKHMNFTISSYGYNTFYYDKAYEIPEGVTAKIATNINDNAITYEEIEDVIPANTGVLLIGTPNQTYTFVETTSDVTYTENLFRGTVADETISNSEVHYILSTHSGQVGMYWPHGTDEYGVGDFENKAHKAYLETSVLNAPARRGFPFNPQSELPTSVETVSGERLEVSGKILRDGNLLIIRDGHVYNAQGVRVQ